ncbi:MAG: hypothetical protein CVU00_06520 [Bacteroidetes bacterium HGW-Bacteroidetes-17]|nr:MAG: hypothetical protein CVU00_06520 [Bacteroidetes bacterium HGW-Bacteroidetes-17]
MNWFEALILGIVQGLTEFLPVSSSGHLELGKALLGINAERSLIFTVIVHGATVLSTIVIFYKDILQLLKGIFRFQWNEETQYFFKIIISMIPVVILGLFFMEEVEGLFTGNIRFVGFMLILTSILLAFTYLKKSNKRTINFWDSFIIGIAQAMAVIPGISRSGATIATGILIGNRKELIAKFNRKYDEFISKNEAIFLKRDGSVAPLISEFEKKTINEFKTYKNDFVSEYITYTIASTFNSIDISYTKRDSVTFDKASIYLKYLHNKPVKYNNPEYINFYKKIFKSELKNLTLKISGMDITKAINEQNSVEALSKALSKYPFLENEEFKSLFMINGLREIYNDKYFTQKNIISILENIKTNSIYPEQQKIAANVIEKLTIKKLAKGSKAPDFELLTNTNKKISLADFSGKYVYINFWATWSIPSQKEMKIMEVLHKKYNSKIEFVSICTDNDKSKMITFLKENPTMNWTFLHIGESRVLLQEYEVRTFPTYILVGKEGEIIKFPAPRPSSGTDRPNEENLERLFYELK